MRNKAHSVPDIQPLYEKQMNKQTNIWSLKFIYRYTAKEEILLQENLLNLRKKSLWVSPPYENCIWPSTETGAMKNAGQSLPPGPILRLHFHPKCDRMLAFFISPSPLLQKFYSGQTQLGWLGQTPYTQPQLAECNFCFRGIGGNPEPWKPTTQLALTVKVSSRRSKPRSWFKLYYLYLKHYFYYL